MECDEIGFDLNKFIKLSHLTKGDVHSILYGRPSDLENFVCIANVRLQRAIIQRGGIFKIIETTIDGMFEFLAERNIDSDELKKCLVVL